MSNQTVGTVYQQIIREVVESSRVDFEEGGVDESVLDELTRVSPALSICQACRRIFFFSFIPSSYHHFIFFQIFFYVVDLNIRG
jgi:transcription initiation factor TFIIA large subunit